MAGAWERDTTVGKGDEHSVFTEQGSLPERTGSRKRNRSVVEQHIPVEFRGDSAYIYDLIDRLAFGGMGEVWLARQKKRTAPTQTEGISEQGRLVAVKRLLSHYQGDQSHLGMFFDEARLQALLSHPNIVRIFDMGEQDEHLFIAMEYVHGVSLKEIVDLPQKGGQPLPLAFVVEIMRQACEGLSYAHNLVDAYGQPLQVVHRDINPHNLLVGFDGQVKLIDFGIAQSEMTHGRTETGTIKGKFAYMSPEQSAAEPLDRRSDVFSLGIVLYEMLTGENPFHRKNVVLSLQAIQREHAPPVESRRRDAVVLSPLIERCLAKDPDQRFSDCRELAEALSTLVRDGLVKAPHLSLSHWMKQSFTVERQGHHDRVKGFLQEHHQTDPEALTALIPSAEHQVPASFDIPVTAPGAVPTSFDDDPFEDKETVVQRPQQAPQQIPAPVPSTSLGSRPAEAPFSLGESAASQFPAREATVTVATTDQMAPRPPMPANPASPQTYQPGLLTPTQPRSFEHNTAETGSQPALPPVEEESATKKGLGIAAALMLVVVVVAGGALWWLSQDDAGGEGDQVVVLPVEPTPTPPVDDTNTGRTGDKTTDGKGDVPPKDEPPDDVEANPKDATDNARDGDVAKPPEDTNGKDADGTAAPETTPEPDAVDDGSDTKVVKKTRRRRRGRSRRATDKTTSGSKTEPTQTSPSKAESTDTKVAAADPVDKAPDKTPAKVGKLMVRVSGMRLKGSTTRTLTDGKTTTVRLTGLAGEAQEMKLSIKPSSSGAIAKVSSTPWGIVRVNGVGAGKTPATVKLPFGKKMKVAVKPVKGREAVLTLFVKAP